MAALAGLESTTGTKIHVAVGEPATYDKAGYKTLFASANQVMGVVTFGQWGDTFNDIQEGLLSEARMLHFNGSADGGEVSVMVQNLTTDAGRDALLANNGTNDLVTIYKFYASGDVEAAVGIVAGTRKNEAGQDTVRGQEFTIRINTAVSEFDAATWSAP